MGESITDWRESVSGSLQRGILIQLRTGLGHFLLLPQCEPDVSSWSTSRLEKGGPNLSFSSVEYRVEPSFGARLADAIAHRSE
jgi:hypothetical protein